MKTESKIVSNIQDMSALLGQLKGQNLCIRGINPLNNLFDHGRGTVVSTVEYPDSVSLNVNTVSDSVVIFFNIISVQRNSQSALVCTFTNDLGDPGRIDLIPIA